MRGISWLAAIPASFSRRTLHHGVSKYYVILYYIILYYIILYYVILYYRNEHKSNCSMGVCGLVSTRSEYGQLDGSLNTVMKLRVPQNAGSSLTSCSTVSFSGSTLLHKVSCVGDRPGPLSGILLCWWMIRSTSCTEFRIRLRWWWCYDINPNFLVVFGTCLPFVAHVGTECACSTSE